MSAEEVTAYIEAQAEPKRSTLLAVRESILEIEPSLEQVIAWNTPQFKYNGKYAVGFAAFKKHLTSSPQGPEVMTVHAAKGLEAAAVFLVNSAPAANNRQGGWQVE